MSEKLISVVLPTDPNADPNSYHIKILRGEFAGIVYKFGSVSFPDDMDESDPQIQFSYDIIEGSVENKEGFETFIGDRLIEMLEEMIKERSVIYSGGIDES